MQVPDKEACKVSLLVFPRNHFPQDRPFVIAHFGKEQT